eukprot:TRINITY_DN13077_c0_g1_i1.p1 TRINITY_DN13077_c0_g1~~TRINITY_DN13077_c0_g1_i1.p1  ORF type:complete len:194 (-),score=40.32 TRINITY_DN13077_c0_g1_i1:267-848(-)
MNPGSGLARSGLGHVSGLSVRQARSFTPFDENQQVGGPNSALKGGLETPVAPRRRALGDISNKARGLDATVTPAKPNAANTQGRALGPSVWMPFHAAAEEVELYPRKQKGAKAKKKAFTVLDEYSVTIDQIHDAYIAPPGSVSIDECYVPTPVALDDLAPLVDDCIACISLPSMESNCMIELPVVEMEITLDL